MKLAIVLLLALASTRTITAQPLTVTARIAEIPSGYGHCGVRAIFAVVRYEVLTVENGTHDAKDIHVIVTCPESSKVGMKHRLVVEPTRWKPDTYQDKLGGTAPRFRATKITRLPTD